MTEGWQEVSAYLLLLRGRKHHPTLISTEFNIIDLGLWLNVSKQRAVILVPHLDDFLVHGQDPFRWVELYLLDGEAVVVGQRANGDWVPHVVLDDFPLLGPHPDVKRPWLELQASYFLLLKRFWNELGHLLILVEKLHFAVSCAHCEGDELSAVVYAC